MMRKIYPPTPKSKLPEHNGRIVAHDRLNQLGYSLHSHCIDSFGRRWSYRTFPMGSGPVNQFETMAQVEQYCSDVEQIRSWQA